MNQDDWDDLCRWLALAAQLTKERARIDEVVQKIARLSAQDKTAAQLAALAAPARRAVPA